MRSHRSGSFSTRIVLFSILAAPCCCFLVHSPFLRLHKSVRLSISVDEDVDKTDDAELNQPPPTSSPVEPMTSTEIMAAMGTSPRRIALSVLSASGIALAGNLFGVTSRVLTAIPERTVEQTGLDTYFPRGDYKRFKTQLYTFVIPKEWVADTALELAKAQRRSVPLDYTMSRPSSSSALPDAAFGPPGNSLVGSKRGDTNVSVLISDSSNFVTVRDMLGSPEKAAEQYLSNINASGTRKGTLISAREDLSRNGLYELEYVIDRGERGPPLQAVSIIAVLRNAYLTMTVVAPASEWQGDYQVKLRKIVSSFHLL